MGAARVYFPCVHGDNQGELNQLTCFVSSKLRSITKVASGIEDKMAENVIGATRYTEISNKAIQSVFVQVSNPNFTGRSYELALAIADKLCRYGFDTNSQYFASGCIEVGGCGAISEIDSLKQKLSLISKSAKSGDKVFFPKENEKKLTHEDAQLIQNMRQEGVCVFFLEHLNYFNEPSEKDVSESKVMEGFFSNSVTRLNSNIFNQVSIFILLGLCVVFLLFRSEIFSDIGTPESIINQASEGMINVLEPVLIPTEDY